jgi:hypothetical protein
MLCVIMLSAAVLSVIMLSVDMLSVVILSVVMLNVVAPLLTVSSVAQQKKNISPTLLTNFDTKSVF